MASGDDSRLRAALRRLLPPEIIRGFEVYEWSPARMLGQAWARKPWQRANSRLRARADAARQQARHDEAIALYRDYLARRPDHAMAWSMLAYCLRMSGRVAEAREAYAQSARLAPRDPFLVATVARFHQLQGEHAQALAMLRQAVAAGAGQAMRNAVTLATEPGEAPAADAQAPGAALLVDVTDALIFLMHRHSVSGIQRVVTALVAQALAEPARIACVMTREWDPRLWSLSRDLLGQLLALAETGQGGSARMSVLLSRLHATAAPVALAPGQVFLRAGGFWAFPGSPPLQHALATAGVRHVLLLHDLIPLRAPHLCPARQVQEFARGVAEEMHTTAAIIANSEHTAADARAWLAERGLPARPVTAVPLAHGLSVARPGALRVPRGQPFVLCVGTIEPRKNQDFLVRLWDRLAAEQPAPPLLVLAGMRGWTTSAFDTAMRARRARVLHIADASDTDIAALYEHCLFTIYPSLLEGWGLPVGEALSRGRLCVVSDRGALAEAGQGFAPAIDPTDIDAALPLLRRLLREPAFRAAQEARLRAGFRPRRWPEVAAGIAAAALAPAPAVAWSGPLLDAPLDWPATTADPAHEGPTAARLMLAEGWALPTPEGAAPLCGSAPLHLALARPGTLRLTVAARQGGSARLGEAAARLGPPATLELALPAGSHAPQVTLGGDARLLRVAFAPQPRA